MYKSALEAAVLAVGLTGWDWGKMPQIREALIAALLVAVKADERSFPTRASAWATVAGQISRLWAELEYTSSARTLEFVCRAVNEAWQADNWGRKTPGVSAEYLRIAKKSYRDEGLPLSPEIRAALRAAREELGGENAVKWLERLAASN